MSANVNIFDLVQHYPIVRRLARELWHRDLITLAQTCQAMHDILFPTVTSPEGSTSRSTGLLRHTLRCDGSSGEAWKSEWYESVAKNGLAAKASADILLSQVAPCQTQTIGHRGSAPCDECGEPVCDTCRVSMNCDRHFPSYSPMQPTRFMVAILNKSVQLSFLMYCDDFEVLTGPSDEKYCDSCEPNTITQILRNADGSYQQCLCRPVRFDWKICVPCFKKRCETRKSPMVSPYICANRRRVPGCRGASRGRLFVCGRCMRERSRDGQLPISSLR